PLSDIDLAKPPGSLKPSGSVTQRPIQDIDLPHNQEFLLQNGDQDPFPSLIGQGEAQVVYAEE
ncbi:Putative LOC100875809, partial [Caligus rogercresseyi]